MKKVFFLLCLLTSFASFAHNGIEKTPTPIAVIVAPPAQSTVFTALQESLTFQKLFKSVIQQAAAQQYQSNLVSGSQNPSANEGRRLQFARKVLNGDVTTINFCMSYLLTAERTYNSLTDDNQLKGDVRDNFNNFFDEMAGVF